MFGAFRDAVVFQCNVRTRSQAAAPQSDNCLSFQLILQVTRSSFSADVEQTERLRGKRNRSRLKNKILPPRTAYAHSSLPCVSPRLTPALAFETAIRKRAPHSRATGSPAVAPESGEMSVHAALPPGIRQARSRHSLPSLPSPPPPPPPPPTTLRPPVRIRPQ